MLYWLKRGVDVLEEPTPAPIPAPTPAPIPSPEPQYDEKEELPVILEREYCSSCITPDGELKCPRRHRCKICKCYLSDEEWFAEFRK